MRTGKNLGDAIAAALAQNGKTQADAARHFNISAPSVSGWLKTGRISKANFDTLRVWLALTPDSHWGATSPPIHNATAQPRNQVYRIPEPQDPPMALDSAHERNIRPFPVITLESVMERLSQYLAQVPQADRGSSSAALAALALQPEDHVKKAAILRLLIEPTSHTEETATGTDNAPK